MRIVGNKHSGLNATPLTPQEAWQRGRVLDAMLPKVSMAQPDNIRVADELLVDLLFAANG